MKIIDNKRDYYDYLVGLYGMDEKIVYDRRGSIKYQHFMKSRQLPITEDNIYAFTFRIGYLVYTIERDKEGKWACPEELEGGWNSPRRPNPLRISENNAKDYNQNSWDRKKGWVCEEITPIAVRIDYIDRTGLHTKWISNPILSSFPGVASFIDPTIVWDEVYNFISSRKEKPIIDTRTDVQKAESHGFDKKTSFRKM